MTAANGLVRWILGTPLHGVLSGSTDVVRYVGRTSGRVITTPTQYAVDGDDVLILVANPEAKTWWRNFRTDRGLDVLIRGVWHPMVGRALIGADDPDTLAPLLDRYLERFPRTERTLGGNDPAERVRTAVLVRCRPLTDHRSLTKSEESP